MSQRSSYTETIVVLFVRQSNVITKCCLKFLYTRVLGIRLVVWALFTQQSSCTKTIVVFVVRQCRSFMKCCLNIFYTRVLSVGVVVWASLTQVFSILAFSFVCCLRTVIQVFLYYCIHLRVVWATVIQFFFILLFSFHDIQP